MSMWRMLNVFKVVANVLSVSES